MCGVFGAQWQAGSPLKTFIAPCLADGVVAPDHRKQGLFGRMLMAALDDLNNNNYSFIFALSANPISYVTLTNLGWRDLGSLREMRYKDEKRNIPTMASRLTKKLGLQKFLDFSSPSVSNELQSPFYFLDKNSDGRRHKVNRYVFVEQAPRPAAMADLIRRIGNDGHIQQVRDEQFFTWRFQNPRSVYRFLFWEDTNLEGYLILRASLYKERTLVRIVDWEAITSNVCADLLQAAICYGCFHNLTIWSATLYRIQK